jgi:hypothetical protein
VVAQQKVNFKSDTLTTIKKRKSQTDLKKMKIEEVSVKKMP